MVVLKDCFNRVPFTPDPWGLMGTHNPSSSMRPFLIDYWMSSPLGTPRDLSPPLLRTVFSLCLPKRTSKGFFTLPSSTRGFFTENTEDGMDGTVEFSFIKLILVPLSFVVVGWLNLFLYGYFLLYGVMHHIFPSICFCFAPLGLNHLC